MGSDEAGLTIPRMQRDTGAADAAVAALLADEPPRAAQFIVTIYGDVVEPRGGTLGMGPLIALCAAFGISESLVRTAVSRLVAAGQLHGARVGRRSYYRLTEAATAEFADAARLFYAPVPPPVDWALICPAPDAAPEAVARAGFAEIGPGVYLGPAGRWCGPARFSFRAEGEILGAEFRRRAAELWGLDALSADYRGFLDRFQPLSDAVDAAGPPAPHHALKARLALVHAYRQIVLRDPRLPLAALPEDWPGGQAGARFADLYRALSPPSDAHVAAALHAENGPLPAETEATRARLATLARLAAPD